MPPNTEISSMPSERVVAELKAFYLAILAAQDAAMNEEDRTRYLGRGTWQILTDIFRRAHEAEALLNSRHPATNADAQPTDSEGDGR